MDISILIVSWNVRDLLLRCLAALPAAVGDGASTNDHGRRSVDALTFETIVVDNASSDGTVEAVREQYPEVQVIANRQNKGFTVGNNQALAEADGKNLFLLNPDTEPHPGSIAALHHFLVEHPQVGIVGPKLRFGDGSIQSSRRRFPTLATLFTESTIIQQWFPGLPLFGRYTLADQPDDQPQQVDWLVGAALFVRRQVYDDIGGLDEGFFMYSEELDWCKRAVDAGWQVAYDPAAEIVHHEGKSSEQVVAARHIRFFSSRVRYTRKVHGAFLGKTLRWWLLATFVFQWLREGAKWLVGHKRALRAERMGEYRKVLRSGLR